MATNSKSDKKSNNKQNKILTEKNFPIVGIGASAGGLEAASEFFKNLPADTGMCFVFVQHQDPAHPSTLPELLAKTTRMPVTEAKEGVIVESNHVYIIPPNKNMTILKGALRLNPRPPRPGLHLPIDSFFQSLAEYSKNKSIGIILSGTASDGTLGLKAIKAAEGITFAQDEESAKYDGMPRNAIAAGVVDFVMRPSDIAKEIGKIGQHPLVRQAKPESELVSEKDVTLAAVFAIIRKATGVDFTHYKPSTIMRRITRRMLLQKAHTLEAYVKFLKINPKEVNALYEDILINVTSFFRDPETFEILKKEIFPKLIKKLTAERAIRVWVPGCSTGEEPYSLAMALLEYLGDKSAGTQIQIFATDISEVAIEKARSGLYAHDIVSDVSSDRLRRFFIKTDQGYQISKSIRDLCIFARHNVVKDPPFSKIDLVSCRNLLIYLSPILQRKVIPLFHYALNPTGVLLLGSTESIGGFPEFFYPADRKYKVFSKKAIPTKLHFEPDTFISERMNVDIPKPSTIVTEKDVLKEGERVLLSKFAPASVIVNQDLQILHFKGQTGAYLEPAPGQASLHLLKMAREGLVLELRSALQESRKTNAPVRYEKIHFRSNGGTRKINLEVIPMKPPHSADRFFLVVFEPIDGDQAEKTKPTQKKLSTREGKQVTELELLNQELSATKEYLQTIIEEQEATNEELRAANEEILSSNEELQSTNEEMETAKEELQSANEELTTVNEELQNRNNELNLVNNDVNNLLSSVHIPIVMLGRDLRIRRFTPSAEKLLNLIPSDLGRPISDINMNVTTPDLEELIADVIDSVQTRDVEVQDKNGRWYNLQMRPYKTMDNKIDGAVLTLIDIDAMKRSVGKLQEYQLLCAGVVEILEQPLVLLDDALKVRLANEAFFKTFRLSKEDTENRNFFELANGQWNVSDFRKLMERILPKRSRLKNYLLETNSRGAAKRKFLINARHLPVDGHQENYILMIMEEVPNSSSSKKNSKSN